MRSVRCDACGTKALVAASQCPKCGHGFEVRNGFGALPPLAHYASCDSYYPEHLGSCKWCGTRPERSPIGALGPYIWKGIGALTFASLAIGAWLAKREPPASAEPEKPAAPAFVADTLPTNQPAPVSIGRKIAARVDTVGVADSTPTIVAADSASADGDSTAATSGSPTPMTLQSAGSVAPPESTTVVEDRTPDPLPPPTTASRPVTSSPSAAPATAPRRTVAKAKAPAPKTSKNRTTPRATTSRPPARALAKATPKARSSAKAPARSRSGRWVTSVARNWAVVRADPNKQSRIIASIGPNTRVQLGELRGDWRRIRARGLSGWVEHRTLVARAIVPPKPGRLAAR